MPRGGSIDLLRVKMPEQKIHLEVLSKEQKKLLPKLAFLKKERFYLAGGTALALQLGHRTSVDFDFYTLKLFQPKALYRKFLKNKLAAKKQQMAFGTLLLRLGNSEASMFYYDYPLIKKTVYLPQGIELASLEDIAAMKLEAIIQRGTRRDFIDLFFLLRNFGLRKILGFGQRKYARAFNTYQALLGLLYFTDAEKEISQTRYKLLKECGWPQVKAFITEEVEKFKQEELRR
jgi:hypothetical protein